MKQKSTKSLDTADAPTIERSNPKTLGMEHINIAFQDIPEDDEDIGRRLIKIDDYEFKLRIKEPYHLWEVYSENGPVPKELQGFFTGQRSAEDALAKYVARKSHEGIIARKHKEALGPNFDKRAEKNKE